MKEDTISREVYKYPYCGQENKTKIYLSEKVVSNIAGRGKKVIFRFRLYCTYLELSVRALGIFLPIPVKEPIFIGVSMPMLPPRNQIVQVDSGNQPITLKGSKFAFTEKQLAHLQQLSEKYKIKYETQEIDTSTLQKEILADIRAGGIFGTPNSTEEEILWIVVLVGVGVVIARSFSEGYVPPAQGPRPQDLLARTRWEYGNNPHERGFGYSNPEGVKQKHVRYLRHSGSSTRNAGSEKVQPSPGKWKYQEMIEQLKQQKNNEFVQVQVGMEYYTFTNPSKRQASMEQLEDTLAKAMYRAIRDSTDDVEKIAENLGYKVENIQRVKDHIFYNTHTLDRYKEQDPQSVEVNRFDPNLKQAYAWILLQSKHYRPEDITWIKHEWAERHHEQKFNSGYSEAHDRAQQRYDGDPWQDDNQRRDDNEL